MKNILITCSFILCIMICTSSCKKDFLDTKPSTEFSGDDIWNDPNLIEAFVNGIYLNVDNPANGGDGLLKGEFVDEMHDQWFSFFEFNNSLITPDDLASWPHENWDKLYKNIRSCNIYFSKINGAKIDDTQLKDRMTGEVHFLRAYLYHQLVSLYGGVPIIKKAYELNDVFAVKRDSYSDCINFISKECDSAALLLPLVQSGSNQGRVTKGAALALKARALLYAASDLHNKPVFSGFAQQELIRYTDGNQATRWRAAKDAAKAVIDLGVYRLYKADPAPGDSIAQNFANIFISNGTEEDIWVRYFKTTSLNGSPDLNSLSLVSGPNGYHLYGQDTPSGEMADHFEMSDGTPFSWSDPSKAYQPYKNRDPRFYASILYEGVKFKPRPSDITNLDPVGVIQVGTWQRWNTSSNSMEEVYGLDSRKGPVENFNGGYTGYYLRKFIDPAINGQFSTNGTPWRYMRYAEVLLNYAEACIELNEESEARSALNQIRKRAGMPNITDSGNALRNRYRNERRVELAFEEHRFYDVRRWLIAPEAYQQFSGVSVVYKLNADHTTATIPTITPIVVQKSAWLDKAYLFPVSRDEINKNALLIQNPNY
ncbi:RagB/SusD family nutrient uptake outer membrane protein [Pedobacter sp. HMWF019]|uniref:RagB/SusD family nutrient uptake outer membrane protein n=1 Tax=Pedobacter sp. HMWF019 TaxID=2056856 RepID=UPI001E3A7F62|nr:RagB/SusD family nutrient uptake outer membrane protein [Pedobacter sp. HMWF019]